MMLRERRGDGDLFNELVHDDEEEELGGEGNEEMRASRHGRPEGQVQEVQVREVAHL